MNGQIYSRPRFGGPVGAPDNRRFTPDPNPYDVPPEPRGYGQGTVDDFLYRPGVDKFEIRKPVLRPDDTFENVPLDFMNQFMNDRGITEQNQEVMGSKEQVFPRYANPEDGTLNNEEMARVDPTDKLLLDSLRRGEIGPLTDPRIRKAIVDLERKIYNDGRASSMDGALIAADPVDKAAYGPQMTRSQFSDYNELRSPGYKDRRDALRMRLINAGILRGV
tara:strand:- start:2455 stop:3114 length:660 start_codon:yes stop_codon:yes gene_type:complete